MWAAPLRWAATRRSGLTRLSRGEKKKGGSPRRNQRPVDTCSCSESGLQLKAERSNSRYFDAIRKAGPLEIVADVRLLLAKRAFEHPTRPLATRQALREISSKLFGSSERRNPRRPESAVGASTRQPRGNRARRWPRRPLYRRLSLLPQSRRSRRRIPAVRRQRAQPRQRVSSREAPSRSS